MKMCAECYRLAISRIPLMEGFSDHSPAPKGIYLDKIVFYDTFSPLGPAGPVLPLDPKSPRLPYGK